jgi:hypothetical protein
LTPDDKESTVGVQLYKATTSGTTILKKSLLTDDDNLNVYEFDKHCQLAYSASTNSLALHFVRTMT